MRFLFIIAFGFFSLAALAQSGADRITFSRFDRPKDLALLDTIRQTLTAGNYIKFISEEKEVYAKGSKTKDFSPVKKLLQKLSSNGSEDVSQCFYPRHSINFYKNGRLVNYVLICFECQGLKFSDERWITKVKSEENRIALLQQLETHFKNEGL